MEMTEEIKEWILEMFTKSLDNWNEDPKAEELGFTVTPEYRQRVLRFFQECSVEELDFFLAGIGCMIHRMEEPKVYTVHVHFDDGPMPDAPLAD